MEEPFTGVIVMKQFLELKKKQRPINNVDITFQSKEFLDRLEASKPEGPMGLIETYEWIYEQSISGVMDQKRNLDKNTLYLFNNTLFNSNEAGNIVWGARMYKFGFNLWNSKDLAHCARFFSDQKKFDEAHDQRAIETGWGWAYMQDITR